MFEDILDDKWPEIPPEVELSEDEIKALSIGNAEDEEYSEDEMERLAAGCCDGKEDDCCETDEKCAGGCSSCGHTVYKGPCQWTEKDVGLPGTPGPPGVPAKSIGMVYKHGDIIEIRSGIYDIVMVAQVRPDKYQFISLLDANRWHEDVVSLEDLDLKLPYASIRFICNLFDDNNRHERMKQEMEKIWQLKKN